MSSMLGEDFDPLLYAQLKDNIDNNLKEFNFEKICKSLSLKIVAEVESRFAEQNVLKDVLDDLENRTNLLLETSDGNLQQPSQGTNRLTSKNSSKPVVIVIDDEDEDDYLESDLLTSNILDNISVNIDDIDDEVATVFNEKSNDNTAKTTEDKLSTPAEKNNIELNKQSSSSRHSLNDTPKDASITQIESESNSIREIDNNHEAINKDHEDIIIDNDSDITINYDCEDIPIAQIDDDHAKNENQNDGDKNENQNDRDNNDNQDEIVFLKEKPAETFLEVENLSLPSPSPSVCNQMLTPEKIDLTEHANKISLLKTLEKVTDNCEMNTNGDVVSPCKPVSKNLKRQSNLTDTTDLKTKKSKVLPVHVETENTQDSNKESVAGFSSNDLSPVQKSPIDSVSKKINHPLTGESPRKGLKVLLPIRRSLSDSDSSPVAHASKKLKRLIDSPSDTDHTCSLTSGSPMVSPSISKQNPGAFFRNLYESEKVYAKPHKCDIWFQAEIKQLPQSSSTKKKHQRYLVQFAVGERVKIKVSDRNIATVDCMQPHQLEIGSRIVAGRPSDTVNSTISKRFKDISSGTTINVMFAGTVAELACKENKQRYLVFFDDGYAQYIPLNRMFPIYASSINVWEDVSDDCREFIKEYLQDYPYRPLVITNIGSSMLTEWNGQWWQSKVVSVDSSLVKLLFDIDKRSEWVYRGTTRLEPLFEFYNNQNTNKKKKKQKNKDSYVDEKITHPQFGISRFSKTDPEGKQQKQEWNLPIFSPILSRQSSSSSSKSSIIVKIPRKKKRIHSESSSAASDKETCSKKVGEALDIQSSEQISSQEALGIMAALDIGSSNPSPEKPVKKKIPKLSIRRTISVESSESSNNSRAKLSLKKKSPIVQPKPQINFVRHKCSADCISNKKMLFDLHNTGQLNYLAIPIMLGWKRESVKRSSGHHRDIYYRTPCNIRLSSLENVTQYLLMTHCTNVCIDMFCFKSNISCRNNISTNKPALVKIDDLAKGEEVLPVECVNELNTDYPIHVEYTSKRIAARDVIINTDREFLSCCDCTDYCQDKKKCACAQLTIEGSRLSGNNRRNHFGYEHRRLKDFISTGVYECNENCKCSKTACFNRVVQNGIKVRLQVFRTDNRGWGLRCVDDIAKGTFICTYAGEVLNEQTANTEGKDFGDEYLAELDHIEVAEKSKDGYESDVPELREGYNSDSSCDEIDDIDNLSDDSSDNSSSTLLLSDDDSPEMDTPDEKLDQPGDSSREQSEKTIVVESLKNLKVRLRRIPSHEIPKKDQDEKETASDESWSVSEKDEKSSDESEDISRNFCDVITSMQNEESIKKDINNQQPPTDSAGVVNGKRKLAKKSTGQKLFGLKSSIGSKITLHKEKDEDSQADSSATRRLFDAKGELYIIDAKSVGNVGRYMNHSCSPNLFVQNVLVDTHDLRFPWVAFFAHQNIPAFTELTWDYNYDVGSVPNKELYCQCGSKNCQGRLL